MDDCNGEDDNNPDIELLSAALTEEAPGSDMTSSQNYIENTIAINLTEKEYIVRKFTAAEAAERILAKVGDKYELPNISSEYHTIEVAKDPDGAINPAGHMLVCEDPCHKELTKMCK